MTNNERFNLAAQRANTQMAHAMANIKQIGQQIKNQARIFQDFGRNNPSAHLHGYLQILREMERSLNDIHRSATLAKNSMPQNAPKNLRANIRGTYDAIDREMREIYAVLIKAIGQVDHEFLNPNRATAPFGSDPVSMLAQHLEMFLVLTKWFKKRQGEIASEMHSSK